MDDTVNIARRHRFGAQYKLIEAEPDYIVPVRMDEPRPRKLRWLFVILLLGAGVWAVLTGGGV